MANSRFDADPNEPYGTCLTCALKLQTETDAREHMAATFAQPGANASHRVRITNPQRADRIDTAVSGLVDSALDTFVEELQALVDSDTISEDEATAATGRWSEFSDAWSERQE